MERKITKKYTNGEVTIVWQNALCIHSGNCVRGLPEVFDVRKNPWINAQGGTTERIIEQVNRCPSGALSFYMNDQAETKS
jgi:uncharacterized Fe-S cluster protein YjdI